jgi:pyruvate dehydrogenase E1 component beta subunit
MSRDITYAQAVLEATDQCLAADPAVYIIGLGVPDPRGIFGTTIGLAAKHGSKRVLDMPVAENAMTGIIIGSSLVGMRPIMTHQRIDFVLLALDQIINNASKWHYMFGGLMKVPLVIRMIIGRGWGQGPQHSQSLHALFAHIPGLKVVMPSSPYDAKGLLIASVRDDNPVIFIEHRWLHRIFGPVPEEMYGVPIGKARIVKEGNDITIVSASHMTIEAIKTAEILKRDAISAEIIDLRTIKPIDRTTIIDSVKKTGKLLVLDDGWKTAGLAAEIIAIVAEKAYHSLKAAPQRITLPDIPGPTSLALANHFYPRAVHMVNRARTMLNLEELTEEQMGIKKDCLLDVPDNSFTGPF